MGHPTRLELLDLTTGETRDLVAAADGSRLVSCDLSFDGRRLVWHERTDESDLWLATFETRPSPTP